MTQRLCDLNIHEQYYCYMNLLLNAGKVGDHEYIKYYLRSFPGLVPDAVEQYFKDHNLPILLQGMSLVEIHSHIFKV